MIAPSASEVAVCATVRVIPRSVVVQAVLDLGLRRAARAGEHDALGGLVVKVPRVHDRPLEQAKR